MRISAISDLNTSSDENGVLALEQRACRIRAAALSLLLLPILVAVMVPSALIAADAIAEPATRDKLAAAPFNSASAFIGVVIWLAMFGIPAFHALRRLGWSRRVAISENNVAIQNVSLLGSSTHNVPLSEFDGLSHHVRTNLSGTRHELILVHPNPSMTLLVRMDDAISQDETEKFAHRFGLKILPPGIMFRQKPLRFPRWPRNVPLFEPQQA